MLRFIKLACLFILILILIPNTWGTNYSSVVYLDAGQDIQAVINACPNSGGCVITLGPGTWTYNTDVDVPVLLVTASVLKSDITIRGSGMGVTTLDYTYAADPCPAEGNKQAIIAIGNSGCATNQVGLSGTSANITISDLTLSGNNWIGGITVGSQNCVKCTGTDNLVVSDVTIRDVEFLNTGLGTEETAAILAWAVDRITIDHIVTRGLQSHGIAANAIDYSSIVNNYIEIQGSTNLWDNGIQVGYSNGTGIVNNTVRGTSADSQHGIRLIRPNGNTTNSQDITVSNNRVLSMGGKGIYVEAGTGAAVQQGIEVSNNIVRSSGDHGIYFSGLIQASQIIGNIVRSAAGDGIHIAGIDGQIDDILITSNTVLLSTSDGIEVGRASGATVNNVVVVNNILRSNTGYGWNILATAQSFLVAGNYDSGNTAGRQLIAAASTGLVGVSYNAGFVTINEGSKSASYMDVQGSGGINIAGPTVLGTAGGTGGTAVNRSTNSQLRW